MLFEGRTLAPDLLSKSCVRCSAGVETKLTGKYKISSITGGLDTSSPALAPCASVATNHFDRLGAAAQDYSTTGYLFPRNRFANQKLKRITKLCHALFTQHLIKGPNFKIIPEIHQTPRKRSWIFK